MSDYYQADLAIIHDRGFGFHAERCAPGILTLLNPVLQSGGEVLELGCGSGHLTRRLVAAGHRVIATDASEAMLNLAKRSVPESKAFQQLVLPNDPLPDADAVVSVGHVLNYLPDEESIRRTLKAIAQSLRPGGVIAIDLQDLSWGASYRNAPNQARFEDDWALISEFSVPDQKTFVRRHILFLREEGNVWRRTEEVHHNCLIDTHRIASFLSDCGLRTRVTAAFGIEQLPAGLVALTGHKVS